MALIILQLQELGDENKQMKLMALLKQITVILVVWVLLRILAATGIQANKVIIFTLYGVLKIVISNSKSDRLFCQYYTLSKYSAKYFF